MGVEAWTSVVPVVQPEINVPWQEIGRRKMFPAFVPGRYEEHGKLLQAVAS